MTDRRTTDGPTTEHPTTANEARATALAGSGALVAILVGHLFPYLGAAIGILAVAGAIGLAYGQTLLELSRRSRAVGAAPDLVCLVVLSLRLEPALERATAFAVRQGDGRLADSLGAHAREVRGRPTAGLAGFADTWADSLPSLRRAAALADAAVDSAAGDRERLLDRTLAVVVDGTRERTSEYAEAVHGPTTAIYAFGVVLPLALVGVVPAAASAGVPLTIGAFALGYGLVLPLTVLGAACWVLARRPVAFQPAAVPSTHPELEGRRLHLLATVPTAVIAAILSSRLLPSWSLPILLVGWPLGAALTVWFQPVCDLRESARDVEDGLADALSLVGHSLRQGQAVEAAVTHAGETLDGATGDLFEDAARRMHRLRVPVPGAFLGDHGPLVEVPSERARAAVPLIAHAADAGTAGGRVLVDVASLFDDLSALDREIRREFAATTRTLRHTGFVYAPLIAGVTVALAGRVSGLEGGGGLPTSQLALAVGGYVLWLAALLPALAVGLERGLDRALVGHHAGIALLSSTTVFPVTATFAARLL